MLQNILTVWEPCSVVAVDKAERWQTLAGTTNDKPKSFPFPVPEKYTDYGAQVIFRAIYDAGLKKTKQPNSFVHCF